MNPFRLFSSALLSTSVLLAFQGAALAEHTRVTYPSAFSIEVLGRTTFYSLNFDQVVSDQLAVGLGIGASQVKQGGNESSQLAVPAYVNYYFTPDQGSVFLTGGVTLTDGSDEGQLKENRVVDLDYNESSVVPTFGIGYENRTDNGYVFRIAAYGLVGDNVVPWAGISIGMTL